MAQAVGASEVLEVNYPLLTQTLTKGNAMNLSKSQIVMGVVAIILLAFFGGLVLS